MKKKPGETFWTTRNGERLNIRDMETSHLRNCLRLLERRKESHVKRISLLPEPSGEMAQLAFEGELEAAMDSSVEELFPVYGKIKEELLLRGENGR